MRTCRFVDDVCLRRTDKGRRKSNNKKPATKAGFLSCLSQPGLSSDSCMVPKGGTPFPQRGNISRRCAGGTPSRTPNRYGNTWRIASTATRQSSIRRRLSCTSCPCTTWWPPSSLESGTPRWAATMPAVLKSRSDKAYCASN
jgi:hypothetical protein